MSTGLESRDEIIGNLANTRKVLTENYVARNNIKKINGRIYAKWLKNLLIFMVGPVLSIFAVAHLNGLQRTFLNKPDPRISPFIVFIAIIIIFFFLGIIFHQLLIMYRKNKYKERINEENRIIRNTYEACKRYSILPEAYWSRNAVELILSYFINKRADTLKEAINLYESEKQAFQRNRTLNYLSQQQSVLIKEQRRTIKEQRRTRREISRLTFWTIWKD